MTNFNSENSPSEFELIAKYFAPLASDARGAYGLTDDAATIEVGPGEEIIVTADLLSAGVHFLRDDPPDQIARKALRVNLSDLAAKGAKPSAYLLSLALPRNNDAPWLGEFAKGLREDQTKFDISLIGGDTTATNGPLTIAITAFGVLPKGAMIRRNGARAGDLVFVSGTLGDAGLGLSILKKNLNSLDTRDQDFAVMRYRMPEPRLTLGLRLRGTASAALDVSDGLIADLGHIASISRARIVIDATRIPLSAAFLASRKRDQSAILDAVTAGDDYEIAFTAPAGRRDAVLKAASDAETRVTEIGRVETGEGVLLLDAGGHEVRVPRAGYTHF